MARTPPRQDQLRLFLFPAPACWECKVPASPFITGHYNSNGNAGRPYYKCTRCPDRVGLYTLADDKNVGPPNPLCYCGGYSRGQRTGVAKGQKLFYKCWDMKCRFWEWADEQDTHSDVSSTPSKASSSQGSWAPAVKVEKSDPLRSPPPGVIAPASHVFQSPSPVKVEKSDAFQSPPSAVAASNSNMFQFRSPPPAKIEQYDPFRSPASAVAAPGSHVFRFASSVKAQPSKAALQSPVQVSCSEVSPSSKKEPLPLPAADENLKEGLSGLTLNSSGSPMPEPKRAKSRRGWRRFLCWKV